MMRSNAMRFGRCGYFLMAAVTLTGCAADAYFDFEACIHAELAPEAILTDDGIVDAAETVARCWPDARACIWHGEAVTIGRDESGRRIEALAYCRGDWSEIVIHYPEVSLPECCDVSAAIFPGEGERPPYCQPEVLGEYWLDCPMERTLEPTAL